MTERRYPYAPIAPLLEHLTARQIGELIDTPTPTIQRWRARPVSTIPEETADALATRLGVHPATVWDDWTDADTRPCAHCDTVFVPRPHGTRAKYCSRRCREAVYNAERRRYKADWARDRYQNDPEYRARKIEAARRLHAECGDYKAAQQRRARASRETAPPPPSPPSVIMPSSTTPDLEENAA